MAGQVLEAAGNEYTARPLKTVSRAFGGLRQRQDETMNTLMKAFFGGVLCVTAVVASTAAVNAVTAPGPAAFAGQHVGTLVQYRGDNDGRRYEGGRRYGNRRNNGRNIGIGIGAAIIGGIILNEAARAEHRSSHGGQWDRCAATYRSFEPSTGMYTGYDGQRRTCPYLN